MKTRDKMDFHFSWFLPGLASYVALVFLSVMPLHAQNIGPVNGTGPGNVGQTINTKGGHVGFGGGQPPTLSAGCGTGATIKGTDSSFRMTSGTGTSSSCTITPSVAWSARPLCNVHPETGSNGAYSVSSSGVISLSGVVDSTVYDAICLGQPGGL